MPLNTDPDQREIRRTLVRAVLESFVSNDWRLLARAGSELAMMTGEMEFLEWLIDRSAVL